MAHGVIREWSCHVAEERKMRFICERRCHDVVLDDVGQ